MNKVKQEEEPAQFGFFAYASRHGAKSRTAEAGEGRPAMKPPTVASLSGNRAVAGLEGKDQEVR